MMAAGRAAELGARVVLIERRNRLGNKLRITGKGRCNVTNDCPIQEFIGHLQPNGMFLRNALERFGPRETISFFERLGVATKVERGRRVFPQSDHAHDVADALHAYCQRHDVRFGFDLRARGLVIESGQVRGVRLPDRTSKTDGVILATGGMSYPRTGSTGDGYGMAQSAGHTISTIRPGLVPLDVKEPWVQDLQGLSLRNVRASLFQGRRCLASEFGEMLFTHFGVSGPIVLTLSSRIGNALEDGPLRLLIDLKPALDEATLDRRLLRELGGMGKARYEHLLRTILPRSMVMVFAAQSGIRLDQRLSEFSWHQRATVLQLLKAFELTVTGTRPIEEAIITLGGVSTREITPQTMASRLVSGLYFGGEIIDIAGDTGGYNLQIAFTTGWLAGEAAAQAWLSQDSRRAEETT